MESDTFNVNMQSPLMLRTSSSISPSPMLPVTLSSISLMRRRRRFFGAISAASYYVTAMSGYSIGIKDKQKQELEELSSCVFNMCLMHKS